MTPKTFALLARSADLLDRLGAHEAADEIRRHLAEPGSQPPAEDAGTVHQVFAGDTGTGKDK